MAVLVACEESQVVTIALRAIGIEAYSCDVQPCSGAHPEWHMQCDVLEVLHDNWDMVIAFPPCTHLSCSGARWFPEKKADGKQQQGIDFFMAFTDLPHVPYVAIENPISIMSTVYRQPHQIIQPWQFGHDESKATCLWLKGLPLLQPTKIVSSVGSRVHWLSPSPDRAKMRSKTFPGIAEAMINQWGKFLLGVSEFVLF